MLLNAICNANSRSCRAPWGEHISAAHQRILCIVKKMLHVNIYRELLLKNWAYHEWKLAVLLDWQDTIFLLHKKQQNWWLCVSSPLESFAKTIFCCQKVLPSRFLVDRVCRCFSFSHAYPLLSMFNGHKPKVFPNVDSQ